MIVNYLVGLNNIYLFQLIWYALGDYPCNRSQTLTNWYGNNINHVWFFIMLNTIITAQNPNAYLLLAKVSCSLSQKIIDQKSYNFILTGCINSWLHNFREEVNSFGRGNKNYVGERGGRKQEIRRITSPRRSKAPTTPPYNVWNIAYQIWVSIK